MALTLRLHFARQSSTWTLIGSRRVDGPRAPSSVSRRHRGVPDRPRRPRPMSLNRRDLLKLGGLSVLGAAGLAVPLGGGASTKSISTLSATKFPKRYAAAFQRPSILTAYKSDFSTPWRSRADGPAY